MISLLCLLVSNAGFTRTTLSVEGPVGYVGFKWNQGHKMNTILAGIRYNISL